jgi:hypothetical protein
MLRTYRSVVLPNSAPAFAVTLIWQFTSLWNDFLFAVLLTGPASWPTTVRLNNLAGSMVVPYSQQMAAVLLASFPTLLVYLLLGRFFMRGLMAGALAKGKGPGEGEPIGRRAGTGKLGGWLGPEEADRHAYRPPSWAGAPSGHGRPGHDHPGAGPGRRHPG